MVTNVWSLFIREFETFRRVETIQVYPSVKGRQILFVVGLCVEFEDFNMETLDIFYDNIQLNFLLDFENLLVWLTELKLNLFSNGFEVVKADFILIERLKTVFSQVNFNLFLDAFEVRLSEIFAKLRQTSVGLFTEIVKVFVDNFFYTAWWIARIRGGTNILDVLAPVCCSFYSSSICSILSKLNLSICVLLKDRKLIFAGQVDVLFKVCHWEISGFCAKTQDFFQKLSLKGFWELLAFCETVEALHIWKLLFGWPHLLALCAHFFGELLFEVSSDEVIVGWEPFFKLGKRIHLLNS